MTDETAELIERFASPVPRYTSYPTAPYFSPRIGNTQYVDWLAALPADAELSLYCHVPFCHELCWYCGCNTKAARRYEPVARYVTALLTEIRNVAALVPPGHRVTHVHWGGGSPNMLSTDDTHRLAQAVRAAFHLEPGAELAVEIDPRHFDVAHADALAAEGFNRVSIGVQDFAPQVQRAIGRLQSFEQTARSVRLLRDRGVKSLNLDLIYGLPYQTLATMEETIDRVLELRPDRIAAFGYAHLPARLKQQRLIDETALPDAQARYALSERAAERLVEAGFVRIGLDHFALPADALARGPVARNFQGYTTDRAAALIGLGASSIGRLEGAYVQNVTPIADYIRRIETDGLAVARGLEMSADDRMRAFVIERLMCEMAFDARPLESRFGNAARHVVTVAAQLVANDRHGLLHPTREGFRVTERGRPFLRSMCAAFDAYLPKGMVRHAAGV